MRTDRFEALDGWRGIAALAIAFYHAPFAHGLRALAGWKNFELFVDFFFVLSGFVICHAWGARLTRPGAVRDFALRRFWRIWPLHFAILLAFLAIELAKAGAGLVVALPLEDAPFTGSRSWEALLSNIVMAQALNLHGTTTWNGPAWSISVEFWTYLLFAGAMLAFRRPDARIFLAIALLGAAGLALLSPIWLFATHDFGLPRAIYGFFLGAATYRLARSERFEIGAGAGTELAAIVLIIAFLSSTGMNWTSLMAPPVFAMVILVFAEGRGFVTRLLESAPVQALGRWSYSIYLVHALLYYAVRLALVFAEKVLRLPLTATGAGNERVFTLGSGLADAVAILTLLVATIALARLGYRYIERPFMQGTGRRAEPAPALQRAPA
ncbi:acyltransferase family protein [Rhabdaerophilum calidifontis]|uniref:acyltransferase family protein n=1 Tax=Rhabdaerophilum calidifontis TaxID=2604328 RepID=UPI001239A902|nr:acyltransferase [Rhabdaerophilum calidifontis]